MLRMDIRPSPIAGTWYADDPDVLTRQLDAYLDAVPEKGRRGELVGVIVPHAGHRYSGPVAGRAFALMRGMKPEVVAVISPMHSLAPAGVVTSGHAAYQTPLGTIPVDQAAVQALSAAWEERTGTPLYPLRNDREHSLEIELPFLQRVLGEFRLLPVMILDQRESTARGLDSEMMRRVESFDPQAVMRAEEEGVGFACGRAAVAAVLWAAKAMGADCVTTLAYANSGEVTKDTSSVVGYGAAAIWRVAPG
jgi:predicted class III extradiol MEMO1 family dioxygenase